MRVLVYERDDATRRWLAGVVRSRGHGVEACEQAEQAWQATQRQPFPLLILDWSGPEGRSLCRRLRGRGEGWRHVVLAAGLMDRPEELEQAVQVGADDYMPKPADAGALEGRLAVAEGQVRHREARARAERASQAAERALRETEQRYALALRANDEGLWDWDLRSDEIYLSPGWKAMLGLEEEQMGKAAAEWVSRIHPDDVERVKAKVAAHLAGHSPRFEDEHRIRHKDGRYRWVLARGVAARGRDGRPTRLSGAQTTLGDRKAFDPLTQLANRALFEERLAKVLARARHAKGALCAVLLIDLDRFRSINDSLGHLAGDELLVATARRLEGSLRPGDLVSRLGGDQFGVLLEGLPDPAAAARVAARLQCGLGRPFLVQGRPLEPSASVGLALSTAGAASPAEMLGEALRAIRSGRIEAVQVQLPSELRGLEGLA